MSKQEKESAPVKTKAGRGSRCIIDAKSRMLVSTLRDYFAKERDTLSPAFDPDDPIGRTACALKLDRDTVKAIVTGKYTGCDEINSDSDSDENEEDTKIKETTGWPEVDCFKMEAIRQVIRCFLMNCEVITRSKFKRALKKNNLFPQTRSLSCVLSHLGFYWRDCLTQQILLERDDFVARRCKFLRNLESVNLKEIIWIGETCVYSTCVNKVSYCPKRRTINKGGRIIVMHAGTSKGWIEGAKHTSISKKINDFHEDIGTKGFIEWFESLLQIIPNNSVIVMEDNLCHSEELNKPPKEHNTREEILDWLGKHNVWISDNGSEFSKAELLGIVSETKSFYPTYVVDDLAARYGHSVERLPPSHSHFNPIEKIFQRIQQQVEKRADACGGLSLKDIEAQTQVAVSSIKPKDWSDAVSQTGTLITKYREQEPKLQSSIETIISNILKLKKSGRAYITKDGYIENQAVSDDSDGEYESTHSKRLRATDADEEEIKKILENAMAVKAAETAKAAEVAKLAESARTNELEITPIKSTQAQTKTTPKKKVKKNKLMPKPTKTIIRTVPFLKPINVPQNSQQPNIIKLPANQVFDCGNLIISPGQRFILPKGVKIVGKIPYSVSNSGTTYKLVSNGTQILTMTPKPVLVSKPTKTSPDISQFLETVMTEDGIDSSPAKKGRILVKSEIPDIQPTGDMGIFQMKVASSEESSSDL